MTRDLLIRLTMASALLAPWTPSHGQERPASAGAVPISAVPAAAITALPAGADTSERAGSSGAPLARLCAGGDVTLGTNIDTTWAARASRRARRRVAALPDPHRLLAPLRPLVRDADVLLLNVEGAIGEGELAFRKCGPRSTSCYAFRQPVAAAGALRRLGGEAPVIGNLANNHASDAGPEGLVETVRHLDEAGVAVTGVDTLATPVALATGDTIAVLGFATPTVPDARPDARDLDAVRRHVARAATRYPRVVVTAHIGAEGRAAQRTRDTTELFFGTDRGNPVAFAHAAVDAGADLVVGHGPHVMRAAEWRDGALILYSLGNLVTYGPFSFAEPMNRGAIACVLMEPDGRIAAAELRPTVQRPPGLVSADRTLRAAVLADSLTRLDVPAPRAPTAVPAATLVRPPR